MVLITDEMIAEAQRHHKDLRMELAVALYSSEVFPLRKAAEIAGVSWFDLADVSKERNIPAWDVLTLEEFEEQWESVRKSYFKQ